MPLVQSASVPTCWTVGSADEYPSMPTQKADWLGFLPEQSAAGWVQLPAALVRVVPVTA